MKIIIALLLTAASSMTFASDAKEATGTFIRVEWGDYQHLLLKVDGEETSFWCMGDEKPLSCEDLEKASKFYRGKKLTVRYQTKSVYVPEAGEEIEQDQLISIRLAK